MQTLKLATLGSLAVFCLMLVATASADDKGAMRLVLGKVKVAETKADGKSAWDVNDGKPDITISVKNLTDTVQKEVVTESKDDVFEATFAATTVLVSPGQKLRIQVLDKDIAENDIIGESTFDVNEDFLKKGTHTLAFGQVKSLVIEFRKP